MIELDYKQLKGELGLDHYEGRSYPGFHHHCTLVTAAHGFLTLERADPNSPAAGLTLPQTVLLLQPVWKCWTDRCSTCRQPINLNDLPLGRPPKTPFPHFSGAIFLPHRGVVGRGSGGGVGAGGDAEEL